MTVEMPSMPDDQPKPPTRRFNRRQLFVAVVVVAVGLGIWNWLHRKLVVIQAATPKDEVAKFYFGFRRHDSKGLNVRNLLSGMFTNRAELSNSLFLVRSGVVEEFVEVPVKSKDDPAQSSRILVAIGEEPAPGGRSTYLGVKVYGHSYSAPSRNASVEHNINVVASETLPGTITPGRAHIVYVEGDRQIVVDASMTVEEFAKANPGNYLVVTVEVR